MVVNDTFCKNIFVLFKFLFCSKGSKTVCKPVSVYAVIHLELVLLLVSSNLPRHNLELCVSIWSCSQWGLPSYLCYHKHGALLPHLFTLTIKKYGGIFSAALSLELPLPGVTRHCRSWRPDFPLLNN